MKKAAFVLTLIFLNCSGLFSQKSTILTDFYKLEWKNFLDFVKINKTKSNPDTTFDVKFYHLKTDVSINRYAKYIKGNVLCKFESNIDNLLQIGLNLNRSLHVDSITGNALSYTIVGDNIKIYLDHPYNTGQNAEVCIWYQGVPKLAGGYKGLRYETHHNGNPIIATLSTPYLAQYWYPCKDGPEDKADSVFIDITVPDTIINGNHVIAVSNGLLENMTAAEGKVTFCWRHKYPIVTYYVMMAISNYSHFQQTFTGNGGEVFPIDYYVFKENDSISQIGVAGLPAVMQFFSDIYGKYPFWREKYGMSELGYYGAIENQTNTIINNMGPDWFMTSLHELSHMWFGDMITCANWHHAWMNEGFATYSEALWQEHTGGINAYHNYLNYSPAYMGGTLYLQNDLDTFNIFQEIVYTKGSWVLHMLRGVLGDSTFFDCLQTYARTPGFMYKNASTEDFRDLCENISGKDLTTFFDQWVYDQYYPLYHYNFEQDTTSKILTLRIIQAQDSLNGWREVFEMPLRIKIRDVNGRDTLITVWNNQKDQEYSFRMNANVNHISSSVILDYQIWVICKTFFKPNLPIGIKEINENSIHFSCYPNPASEEINIEFQRMTKNTTYQISDQLGRIVKKGLLNEFSTRISISNLYKGIYILKVGDDTHIKTIKFLKL